MTLPTVLSNQRLKMGWFYMSDLFHTYSSPSVKPRWNIRQVSSGPIFALGPCWRRIGGSIALTTVSDRQQRPNSDLLLSWIWPRLLYLPFCKCQYPTDFLWLDVLAKIARGKGAKASAKKARKKKSKPHLRDLAGEYGAQPPPGPQNSDCPSFLRFQAEIRNMINQLLFVRSKLFRDSKQRSLLLTINQSWFGNVTKTLDSHQHFFKPVDNSTTEAQSLMRTVLESRLAVALEIYLALS